MSARELHLVVDHVDDSVPGVRSVGLVDPAGERLPAFGPGAHIVLTCGGVRNAYSLTGDVRRRDSYSVSVQLSAAGRGGSEWVHRALGPGSPVVASTPRNLFAPVPDARRSIYVAGGIGVTPLLSHLREAARRRSEFEFVYAVRDAPAHLDEVSRWAGDRLRVVRGRAELLAHLEWRLADQPIGTFVYVCGPEAMTEAVLSLARRLGWPEGRLRVERFAAAEAAPGRPFTVRTARSGATLRVPAGSSLLDSLLAAGLDVPSLCRQGVCGECRVGVRAGRIDHRDAYLSEEERRAGTAVMACVSRADGELELDL